MSDRQAIVALEWSIARVERAEQELTAAKVALKRLVDRVSAPQGDERKAG